MSEIEQGTGDTAQSDLPTSPPHDMGKKRRPVRWTDWLTLGALVVAFLGVAIQTVFLVRGDRLATKSAKEARISADAANQAADVARQTLVASERAWIRVDDVGIGSGALAFDQNGASVSIALRLTNIGNSPALNVTPKLALIVSAIGSPSATAAQTQLCKMNKLPITFGFSIFPNETFPTNAGIPMMAFGISASKSDIEKGSVTGVNRKYLELTIVGCVDYTFPTDPDHHHQTGFAYDIFSKDTHAPVDPDGGNIPAQNLELRSTGLGAGRYAD